MKRITVVTPCLNSEQTIEQTLQSVASQREDGLEVEHLVMDGGSTDGTAAIVARYAHPNTRWVVQKDSGPADAINHGFRLATGEYYCWLNADDVYAPHALKRAVRALENHPKRAFCFGRCPIINENGVEIRRPITLFKEFWYPFSCHFWIRVLNYISQPAMVFRRAAFEAIGGALRTDLKAAWDYELTLRLWHQGGGTCVGGAPMAYFRWMPTTISGQGYHRQFKEELAVAQADAGRWALSSLLHRVVCWGIVSIYNWMNRKRNR